MLETSSPKNIILLERVSKSIIRPIKLSLIPKDISFTKEKMNLRKSNVLAYLSWDLYEPHVALITHKVSYYRFSYLLGREFPYDPHFDYEEALSNFENHFEERKNHLKDFLRVIDPYRGPSLVYYEIITGSFRSSTHLPYISWAFEALLSLQVSNFILGEIIYYCAEFPEILRVVPFPKKDLESNETIANLVHHRVVWPFYIAPNIYQGPPKALVPFFDSIEILIEKGLQWENKESDHPLLDKPLRILLGLLGRERPYLASFLLKGCR